MINFVKKDFIVQKKILLLYIAMLVFFCFSHLPPVSIVPIVLVQFLVNIGYYDDRDKVHLLLNALPGNRRKIITAKYLSNAIFLIICLLSYLVINYIINRSFITIEEWIYIIAASILLICFFIPLSVYFRYTIILVIFFIIYFGAILFVNWLSTWLIPNAGEWINEMITKFFALSTSELAITVVCISTVLLIISWFSSVKLYSMKKI